MELVVIVEFFCLDWLSFICIETKPGTNFSAHILELKPTQHAQTDRNFDVGDL